MPVDVPSELPAGCRMPLGKGFVSELAGVLLPSVEAM